MYSKKMFLNQIFFDILVFTGPGSSPIFFLQKGIKLFPQSKRNKLFLDVFNLVACASFLPRIRHFSHCKFVLGFPSLPLSSVRTRSRQVWVIGHFLSKRRPYDLSTNSLASTMFTLTLMVQYATLLIISEHITLLNFGALLGSIFLYCITLVSLLSTPEAFGFATFFRFLSGNNFWLELVVMLLDRRLFSSPHGFD